MSTRSKLNPKYRENRAMRRALLADVNALCARTRGTSAAAAVVNEARLLLTRIRACPWRNGDAKQAIVARVARELSETERERIAGQQKKIVVP